MTYMVGRNIPGHPNSHQTFENALQDSYAKFQQNYLSQLEVKWVWVICSVPSLGPIQVSRVYSVLALHRSPTLSVQIYLSHSERVFSHLKTSNKSLGGKGFILFQGTSTINE
jgi:hypothetical protein